MLLLASCGEDRSGEYYALTEENQWIYNEMKQYYLWYDQMPTPSRDAFFGDPEDFFGDLLISTDKYSYYEAIDSATTRSIDYTSTYGFDFVLYTNPLGTSSEVFARVILVLPNTPADKAGLKRGDWIKSVGGTAVTNNNYGYLMEGSATTLETVALATDTTTTSGYTWVEGAQLQLAASGPALLYPFYVDTIYTAGSHKVAYFMYNRFTPGPNYDGDETAYNSVMNGIFDRYKRAGITDLIVDLRYNPGGYLSCAQQLGSLIVPSSAFGTTFCSLVFNNKNSAQNTSYKYWASLTDGSYLSMSKFYVITGSLTASASEAVIYDLRGTMGDANVVTVGTKTVGKNLASIPLQGDYKFILHPIVATVYDCDSTSDYSDGIAPDYAVNELSYLNKLLPLGDTNELLLNCTLSLITTGALPSYLSHPSRRTAPVRGRTLFNSVSRHDNSLLVPLRP